MTKMGVFPRRELSSSTLRGIATQGRVISTYEGEETEGEPVRARPLDPAATLGAEALSSKTVTAARAQTVFAKERRSRRVVSSLSVYRRKRRVLPIRPRVTEEPIISSVPLTRTDRLAEIMLREESEDWINLARFGHASGAIEATLFKSHAHPYAFADLVSEDLISVEYGKITLTPLASRMIEELVRWGSEGDRPPVD